MSLLRRFILEAPFWCAAAGFFWVVTQSKPVAAPTELDEFWKWMERLERLGPWVLLLIYYFFRLDRQMVRVIEVLEDIRSELIHARRDRVP